MSPLGIIIAIVLIDLIGFTIVMPLLPRFAAAYHFSGFQIGLLMAAYPMLQLVAGPILGRLSDRFGRRPLLVISQAGTALSFLILGLAENFPMMLLGRMLDGASGGNILVAQAYVADVTKPEQRARSLGLIGAAFGIGFVLGPLVCALLLTLPVAAAWRLRVPFLVAAGFSTVAWLLVVFRLPESRPGEGRGRVAARVVSWRGLVKTVSAPRIGALVGVAALAVLAFSALEGSFSLFLRDRLNWSAEDAAFGFAFLGLISALVQGGLIRWLVPRFGEARLIVAGLALLAIGLPLLGLSSSRSTLLATALIVGVGHGLASPSLQGLLSRWTPPDDQGAVFGTLSAAQTLARMTNYLIANILIGHGHVSAPFWEGGAVALGALAMAIGTVHRTGPAENVPSRQASETIAAQATARHR
jgi:DHA1 family tetracycline resistance protein-like MFS transporter